MILVRAPIRYGLVGLMLLGALGSILMTRSRQPVDKPLTLEQSRQLARELKHALRPDAQPNSLPNEWQFRMVAWPDEEISLDAVTRVRRQARVLRERPSATPRAIWQQAGPLNVGGRVTDIALDLQDTSRVFVGSAAGGVFRTTDAGANWTAVFQEEGALAIGDVALDPQDGQTVWVGTGESNSSSYGFPGNGLWKSTDGGDHWQPAGLDSSFYIGRIVVDPQDSQRIWVAAMGRLYGTGGQRGVYRSVDGGQSWTRTLFVNDSTSATDLALDPQNPQRIYAATWQRLRTLTTRISGGPGSRVWRSDDGGVTWAPMDSGLPTPGMLGRPAIAVAPGDPQRVYVSFADDPGYFMGLWRSDNGGDSFTATNSSALNNIYSNFGWYFGNLRVDPLDPDHVLALGVTWWRSLDGGANYNRLAYALHVDFHAMERHPLNGRWWVGNDGGLYTSLNLATWVHFVNLPLTQFYTVEIDPVQPERLYGGTQDNGTIRTLSGQLDDWDDILGGDGFHVIVHPSVPDLIFAEYQWGSLYRSTNGGGSFSSSISGISTGDRRNWNTPVVLDPVDTDVLYYGTQRVWRSTNLGLSWSAVSGDLTSGFSGDAGFNTITSIAVSPLDNAVIWAGCDDGRLARTLNHGSSWQDVSSSLVTRWISDVVADPHHVQGAIVSLGGLRWNDPQPHIYRTWDAGAHWTPISAGLPDAPVYALAIDPADSLRIWVGAETGCYTTADGGQSWSETAPGLPLGPVMDLDFHPGTRQLVAGTHGRSAFRLFVDDTGDDVPVVHIRLVGNAVRLSWSPIAGASGYGVYASESGFFPGEAGELLTTTADTLLALPIEVAQPMRFFRVRSQFP